MTHSIRCPQCSGTLSVEEVGELRDKWLSCSFCGHRIDVPDEYEVTHATEESLPGGTRRVAVTQRRRDLGAGEPPEDMKPILQRELRRAGLPPEIADLADFSRMKPGEVVLFDEEGVSSSTTTSSIQVQRRQAWDLRKGGDHAGSPEELPEVAEKIPLPDGVELPAEIGEMLRRGALKPGATHVTTRTVTQTRRVPASQAPIPGASPLIHHVVASMPATRSRPERDGTAEVLRAATSLTRWLVLLAAVVALLVILLR